MVKNIEHPKRTISSLKKGDEHSRHFQRGFYFVIGLSR